MACQVRNSRIMSRGFLTTFFSTRRDDVSRLRQSATDAASDLSNRTHGALLDAADAFRHESRAGFDRAAAQFNELARSTRELARQRPLTCLAVVLAVGCGIGLLAGFSTSRSRRR